MRLFFSILLTLFYSKQIFAQEMIAKDGAWCWFSDPRAVYHKGTKEAIYFAYINSKGDVVISARDHHSKKIQTFILHDTLEIDDHNVPAILFLPDGKILTFYSEHNGRYFSRKSKNAEDITEWEDERPLPFNDKRITYAHPAMLSAENNRIYLFWRGRDQHPVRGSFDDWQQYYSYSDDKGETWQEGKAFLTSKGLKNTVYLKVCSDNVSRIDFAFTDGHPGVGDSVSLYHIYYANGIFCQTDGKKLAGINDVPLQINRVNKVYDFYSTHVRSWISDIALDRQNRPVIVYGRFPTPRDHRYHYARWTGTEWMDSEMCKSGRWMPADTTLSQQSEPYYSGGIALDHQQPENVYLSRQINGTFEIEHWQRTGNSWKQNALTSNSSANNVRPYVVYAYPGNRPVVMWMNGAYQHYTDYHTSIRIEE